MWDKNRDGTANTRGIRDAVLSLGVRHVSVDDLQTTFDAIDRDGSGSISYVELDKTLMSLPRERPMVKPPSRHRP